MICQPDPHTNPSANGFTLVEMLVALFIFGLLSAAGVSLLRSSADSQIAINEKLDEVALVNRLSGILTADMAQALPRTSRDTAGGAVTAFATDHDGMLFEFTRAGVSNFDNAARPDLQRVAYSFTDGQLIRHSFDALDGSEPALAATVMPSLASVDLRVREETGEWRNNWTPPRGDALPRAIELRLTTDEGVAYKLMLAVGSQSRPVMRPDAVDGET